MLRFTRSHKSMSGFTLIELLIVIGLLGALTALVLPSMMADREEAMGDVCDYNQAGTVRVLKQYNQLTSQYPDDMHTGLMDNNALAAAMGGLPHAQQEHMVDNIGTTRHALTASEADSLNKAGINHVCYGTGLTSETVQTGTYVCQAANGSGYYWEDDSDPAEEMTFDGVKISDWCLASDSPDGKDGIVVALWIAPTINWEANTAGTNKDWGNGAVSISIEMEGQCPIPQEAAVAGDEVTFAYYMAYFKVYADGTEAKMIGSTCPECGVLNP